MERYAGARRTMAEAASAKAGDESNLNLNVSVRTRQ